MNTPDPRLGRLVLLGENYGDYGSVGSTRVGSKAAAAISVGSSPDSPSHQFKADYRVLNEDALCVMEAGDWSGYAVADAHYGPESSHMLIGRLHEIWAKVRPTNLEHLSQMLEFLRQGDPASTESETTLLAVVYDRVERTGFGISFGDSSFALVGPGNDATPLNRRDNRYVNTRSRSSLRNGSAFKFSTNPGDMMLAYTDGIDECHYRSPATSVQPHHVMNVVQGADGDALAVANTLVAAALAGVDGHPGGEDNIALITANA